MALPADKSLKFSIAQVSHLQKMKDYSSLTLLSVSSPNTVEYYE